MVSGLWLCNGIFLEYKYHIQPQAEGFARAIIPVPQDYLLRDGLDKDFPKHFAKLCEIEDLVKAIGQSGLGMRIFIKACSLICPYRA